MRSLKFEHNGFSPDGERLYDLVIDEVLVESGLTIDQVVEHINRNDERRLGKIHVQTPEDLRQEVSRR